MIIQELSGTRNFHLAIKAIDRHAQPSAQARTPSPSCCTVYTIYCHIVYADLSVLCRLPAHKSIKKTINFQPLWVNKKSIKASGGIVGDGGGGGVGGGLSGQFGARLGPIVINKCALRAALALKYSYKSCLTNSQSCHLLSPAPAALPAPFCCLQLNQFCTFEMR